MIQLAHLKPFAGGKKRNCYVHPDDPNKVVKIIPPEKAPEILLAQKYWFRRFFQKPESLDANSTESKKIEKLRQRFGDLTAKLPYLAEYFGEAETDLGEGLVFQLIKNYDGQISETVLSAGRSKDYDKSKLLIAVKELASHSKDGLIFNDVGKNNVVIQVLTADRSRYKLWIVDGIQCGPLIPLSEYSDAIASIRKAKKIWQLKRYIHKHFNA